MLHRTLALTRLALGFACVLAGAAPALAQGSVSYPPSRALNDIGAWLQRDTPIAAGQVVDVSPSAITAVTSASPLGQPRGFLATVSSEALDPEIVNHEGVASWSIPVEVDCDQRQVRLGLMTGFHGRDLRTDPQTVRQPDTAWVNPNASAPLGSVIRALCDRDFHRPFDGRKIAAAKPAPPPKAPKVQPQPQPQPQPTAEPPAETAEASARPPALRPTLPAPQPTLAKARPPAGGGAVAVQIGASPSRPDIEAALAKFRKAHAEDLGGLNPNVATVQVDGKTVSRALISGFASNAEAGAFCKKLEASGQACFIRR